MGRGSTLTETDAILSLSLSRRGRLALLALGGGQLRLWDLERMTCIGRYAGHQQSKYVVRACLGGVDDAFVLSGSEGPSLAIRERERERR
jgi:WD repeat-containing protein 26